MEQRISRTRQAALDGSNNGTTFGDTKREADSTEVNDLRSENEQLKTVVAELTLRNRTLKKSLLGRGIKWDD
jgi:hypothetical protein